MKGGTVTFKNPKEVKLNITLAVFNSSHFTEGLPFLQSNKHDINITIIKWYRVNMLWCNIFSTK